MERKRKNASENIQNCQNYLYKRENKTLLNMVLKENENDLQL